MTLSRQNIKSAEELEAEDREAQSAKLQELIRRGTPRDLAAAQELMKTLAGANPDAKPDYRTQSLTELNKLESKVILLNEILDNVISKRARCLGAMCHRRSADGAEVGGRGSIWALDASREARAPSQSRLSSSAGVRRQTAHLPFASAEQVHYL